MSPLQILRIFDYQQPAGEQSVMRLPRSAAAPQQADQSKNGVQLQVERRANQDRRANERREKQQATFLNTRKRQGRRQAAGRRATDVAGKADYRPISFKG